MTRALDGIRILDFTRYQQGPFATVLLSDLGAAVVKVEPRLDGDLGRSLGLEPDGWCGYFEAHNRNKRSITIDVRKPEGREIIYKLVPQFDVVVDNFRPGVMQRLGLDLDALRPHNPAIITASATGFGERGPLATQPSFDIIAQAMGGIMMAQGGGPDRPPQSVLGGTADQYGATILALGITAALFARDRQGLGQHVDTSLLGSQIALQGFWYTRFLRSRRQSATPQRWNPVFCAFRAADDRYLAIGVLDPRWYDALCRVLERPDLATDERFATAHARAHHRDELLAELDQAFSARPRDDWLRLLREADVPTGPVHDYAAASRDPQILANDYLTTLEHPSLGTVGVVGSPIGMSAMETGPRATAPELGQHTEEILQDLGYDWEAISALRDAEVI